MKNIDGKRMPANELKGTTATFFAPLREATMTTYESAYMGGA